MSISEHYTAAGTGGSELERLRRRVAALTDDNRRLRRREALMRTAVASGGVGWWLFEPETKRLEGSEAFKANFGRRADDPLRYEDLHAQIHPEDRARRDAAMAQAMATGAEYAIDYRVAWPDGQERALEIRGTPVFGSGRRLLGLAGVSLDVTARKREEDRDRLLRDELNHRLKNAMTTVQALASQSLRGAESPESFKASFSARLQALGRTLTLPQEAEPATLASVLVQALEPYVEVSADRFAVSGPVVPLSARAAQSLGLLAHELATNAMKYGALSGPEGRVDVTWTADEGGVRLMWRESGGPPVTAPARRGFGSRLIERAMPLDLGGRAELDFAPDGLVCRLTFPRPT